MTMLAVAPELQALLNSSDQFIMADLYSVTLAAGGVLRWTSADIDLAIEGHVFSSVVQVKRDKIKVSVGLEVDTLNLTVYPDESTVIDGTPFVAAVRAGALDGAVVLLERAFFTPVDWEAFAPYIIVDAAGNIEIDSQGNQLTGATAPSRIPTPDYVGKITRFIGLVSDIEQFTGTEVPITVKSYLELLNVNMPRNIYQPTCRRTLFDAGCALVKNSGAWHSDNVAVTYGGSKGVVMAVLPQATSAATGNLLNYPIGTGDGTKTSFTVALPHAPNGVSGVYFNGGRTLMVTSNGVQQTIGYGQTLQGTDATIEFELAPDNGTVITADFPYSISGYYDLGTVTFTSGANAGQSRTIKQCLQGIGGFASISFALPLPCEPVVGDLFSIYAGCDKQQTTCAGKFSNLANFSAEPYVPVPETVY